MGYTATGRKVNQTIAFRATDEQVALMDQLRATFAEQPGAARTYPASGWGAAFRWLLDDERVRAVIAERVSAPLEHRVDI